MTKVPQDTSSAKGKGNKDSRLLKQTSRFLDHLNQDPKAATA